MLGCGAVTSLFYLPALQKNRDKYKVVATVDKDINRAGQVSMALGAENAFADYKSLISLEGVDCAIVALPHFLHAPVTIELLQAGINVLCEKPMALNLNEARQMVNAQNKMGKTLAIGLFRRFFPSIRLVKELIQGNILGPVRRFLWLEGEEKFSWPAQSNFYFNRSQSGGGALIDGGAHTVDLLLWWFGEVQGFSYYDDAMGGVEANCRLELEMAGGAKGVMRLSRDCALPNKCFIECEKGWITYTLDVTDRLDWGLYGTDAPLSSSLKIQGAEQVNKQEDPLLRYFEAQLADFVNAVQTGKEPLVSGQEALKSMALIDACYHKRKLIQMGWLSETEQDRAKFLQSGLKT